MTICSTSATAYNAQAGEVDAWLHDDVWTGPEDWHKFPLVRYSEHLGTVQDVLPLPASGEYPSSLLEYFDAENVQYQWCWVGYHIHKKVVNSIHEEYCPLDVFYQTSEMRRIQKERYDHWIIRDAVAPCMAHISEDRCHQGMRDSDEYDS